jgi:pimeloyl-ACP methyl ester carboxylesterase
MYEVFFEGCYDAAENCTLYRSDDSSAKDIQNRVDDLILDLDKAPQVARVVERGEIGRDIVVTGADIRVIFGNAAYSAMVSYPRLAGSIDAAMTGDFSILAPQLVGLEISSQCTPADPTIPNVIEEQGLAIRCVDGDDVTDKDADYWVDYVGQVMEQSDIYGQAIAAGRMWCSGWPVRGSWDYNGPFRTPKANSAGVKGKPLAPTFFMSNRLDPVTPLQAARTMSKEHPGSRVLVVEGEGHCSILSGPSKCRDKLLREYLHTGNLPDEKETICEMDCGTWEGCDTAMSDVDQTVLMRHVLGIPLHL